jgi:hypothetical protein
MSRALAVALGVASILSSTAAGAALLQFESLTLLEFSNLDHAQVSAEGTGVVQVNGADGLGPLDSVTFITVNSAALNSIIPITDPIVTATIASVRITSARLRPDLRGNVLRPVSGVLQNTVSQLTQNTVPFTGNVRICLFYAGCNSGHIDLVLGQTLDGEWIGPGVGGTVAGTEGSIRISLQGAPWTVRTASVSNRTISSGITMFTVMGFAHGPESLTSSAATPGGVVQFVTANQVTSVGIPGNNDITGQLILHRLHFIPEPGLLLLLGSGALAMAVLGRRRLRS